jgi:hypothetical protein
LTAWQKFTDAMFALPLGNSQETFAPAARNASKCARTPGWTGIVRHFPPLLATSTSQRSKSTRASGKLVSWIRQP